MLIKFVAMVCTLHIVGEIKDTTLSDLQAVYNPNCESVAVVINSIGGDPIAAIEICKWLKSLGKPIQTQAIKAYSAASIVWIYASDNRIKHPKAVDKWLMWHRPTADLSGANSTIVIELLAVMQWVEGEMTSIYATETGLTTDEVAKLMNQETYFDDALAKKYKVLAMSLPKKNMSLIDRIGGLLSNSKTMNAKIKAMHDVPTDQVPEVDSALESAEPDLQTKYDDLQTKHDELQAKYDELFAKTQADNAEKLMLESSLTALGYSNDELSSSISALSASLTKANGENVSLQAKVETLGSRVGIIAMGSSLAPTELSPLEKLANRIKPNNS